ncbi:unnamed protein product [Amoebophrya sp. A25]|nr:unnamed protein product [Amoebophrya sp. A25]|eukprot:GSA25T00025043001.1
MILLPDTIRMVFLSATIPNANEFAEWICRIKHQCCHLIYTDYRPVPLQHYLFPTGSDQVHLIVDELGKFREEAYQKAILSMQSAAEKQITDTSKQHARRKQDQGTTTDLEKVIGMCMTKNYLPCIVFSFAKKQVEKHATALNKTLDLTTRDEKLLIKEVFQNAVSTLPAEDQHLPAIEELFNLVLRGIGIHHGGLLPVMKEVVEILFQENLCKVLFATETFAMGVNMPAKTVVFAAVRKWDGVESRVLNTAEYIQMAGRAGRRGKDKQGLCIVLVDEKIEPETAKTMFLGNTTKLKSAFYLSYNMLLNLLRIEGGSAEYMIERSFRQFQTDKTTLARKERLESILRQLEVDLLSYLDREEVVKEYMDMEKTSKLLENASSSAPVHPEGAASATSVKDQQTTEAPAKEEALNTASAASKKSSKKKKNKQQSSTKLQRTASIVPATSCSSSDAPALRPPPTFQCPSGIDDVVALLQLYFGLRASINDNEEEIRRLKMQPEKIAPFLNAGRVVYVDGYGWGFVFSFAKKINSRDKRQAVSVSDDDFWQDWLLNVFVPTKSTTSTKAPPSATSSTPAGEKENKSSLPEKEDVAKINGHVEREVVADIVAVELSTLRRVSQVRAQQIEKRTAEEVRRLREPLLASLDLIVSQFEAKGGVPELQDYGLETADVEKIALLQSEVQTAKAQREKIEEEKLSQLHPIHKAILLEKYEERLKLMEEKRTLEAQLMRGTYEGGSSGSSSGTSSNGDHAPGAATARVEDAQTTRNGDDEDEKKNQEQAVEGASTSSSSSTAIVPVSSSSASSAKKDSTTPAGDIHISEELHAMMRVLRALDFVDNRHMIQLKGKLACELSSADEILLTELVFRNQFENLSPEHIVALLSCLIFDEGGATGNAGGAKGGGKGKGGGKKGGGKKGSKGSSSNSSSNGAIVPTGGKGSSGGAAPVSKFPALAQQFEAMKAVALDCGRIMEAAKLPNFDLEKYVEAALRPQLMDLCVFWMEGYKFQDLMNVTDIYEGSVIRVIRRLEEMLRELADALRTIGNTALQQKLHEGRAKLKRGIIFAASLYL